MEGETLYGSEDSQSVMSERVQTLARNIYQEFQRMIQKYDEDVVKVRRLGKDFLSHDQLLLWGFLPPGSYASCRQHVGVPGSSLHS